MQEPSKTEPFRGRKVKVGIMGILISLILCISWLDVRGIFTLLMIPIPVNAAEDRFFGGGIDSQDAFRKFVVYQDYSEIKIFYETELRLQGWSVETINEASSKEAVDLVCLRIAKFSFFNAFIEIYGYADSNRTSVYIMPHSTKSICQNKFLDKSKSCSSKTCFGFGDLDKLADREFSQNRFSIR